MFFKAKKDAAGPVRLQLHQMKVEVMRRVRLQYIFANRLGVGRLREGNTG